MYQELSDRLGAYDSAISGDLVKLKRWLNMAQQYICGKRLWPFMLAEEIVQTVTDVTTGSLSVDAGASAVTFATNPVGSYVGRYIQLQTTQDWYKITAHVSNSITAFISPAYVGTSNAAFISYKVRKLLYTTTTPLIQILDMKQLVSPMQLISQAPSGTDFFLPLYYDVGATSAYVMSSPSSTGGLQFSFMQSPDAVMNIMIRGIRALADLSATSDESIIPSPWHDAMINIGAHYGFQSLDDTRAKLELEIGESRIEDMSRTYSHDLGRHRVMQSIDNNSNPGLTWTLPSNIGPVS